jgi:hypothetical protein
VLVTNAGAVDFALLFVANYGSARGKKYSEPTDLAHAVEMLREVLGQVRRGPCWITCMALVACRPSQISACITSQFAGVVWQLLGQACCNEVPQECNTEGWWAKTPPAQWIQSRLLPVALVLDCI